VVEGGSLEGGVLMNIERDIASFTLRAAISEHEPTAAPVDQRCGVFYVDRPLDSVTRCELVPRR
jgi:hypothetical protein